jgi:hypothetical protein
MWPKPGSKKKQNPVAEKTKPGSRNC